jgi:hypothetical protein
VSAAGRRADNATVLWAPGNSYLDLSLYADGPSTIVERLIGKLGAMNADASDRPALERYADALRAGDRGLAQLASASPATQVTQASSILTSQSIPADPSALGAPASGASVSSL